VIGPSQRLLPENIQHLQDADVHVPGGIRTRIPSQRAVADPLVRTRGHSDQQATSLPTCVCVCVCHNVTAIRQTEWSLAGRCDLLYGALMTWLKAWVWSNVETACEC